PRDPYDRRTDREGPDDVADGRLWSFLARDGDDDVRLFNLVNRVPEYELAFALVLWVGRCTVCAPLEPRAHEPNGRPRDLEGERHRVRVLSRCQWSGHVDVRPAPNGASRWFRRADVAVS